MNTPNGRVDVGRNRHQARLSSLRKFPNKVAVSPSRPMICSVRLDFQKCFF